MALLDAATAYEHVQVRGTVVLLNIASIRFTVLEACVSRWASFPYDEKLYASVQRANDQYRAAQQDYTEGVKEYLAVERISKSFRSLNKQLLLPWRTFRNVKKVEPEIATLDPTILDEQSSNRYNELYENMRALIAQENAKVVPLSAEARERLEYVRAIHDKTIESVSNDPSWKGQYKPFEGPFGC